MSTYLALYQYRNIRCSFNFNFIFHGLRLSCIKRSNYIESNDLGRKSCPVSGIERIRYSECFFTLKIEGKKSGPTKSSGFMGIPVLRGSGLEGFYCIRKLRNIASHQQHVCYSKPVHHDKYLPLSL